MTAVRSYTEADIHVLEGLEAVCAKPGMYIGPTDKQGLHHLVWEIVDNAVDEYLNGHADVVHVTVHKKHDAVTVTDNGRGIPVGIHPKFKKPTLELILTTLHSGGKFSEGQGYDVAGGTHGVGSSVVNALSKKMVATIRRDGHEWRQAFSRGKTASPLEKLNPTRQHGTTVYFEPDEQIFRTTTLDGELIRKRLEAASYVHPGLKIVFFDERTGEPEQVYRNEGGVPAYLARLVKEAEAAGKPSVTEIAFTAKRDNGEKMEVALQWTDDSGVDVRSYVNGIPTWSGGTHESGFKAGVAKAVKNYIETHDVKVKGLEITADDMREGIVAVLSVFVRQPMFHSQVKDKLVSTEVTASVDNFVRSGLEAWLNANRSAADAIIGRIVTAARARLASREAVLEVKRKSVTSRRLNLPGKLKDCKSTSLDETELFIVEGDSAGGSASQGRDNKTQVVLPLRGKILNSEGLPLGKVLTNAELNDLISAIGTGIGDKFNIENLRYGKLILLMDADADGVHISTLLLAFFFRHLPKLIERGHVFLAQPPLYKIEVGKETHWAKDDVHKEQIIGKLRKGARFEVSRFKGLGEMDPDVLKKTTMDPNGRTLLKMEIDSLLDTDRTFVDLLGKDAGQRHRFVMDRSAELTLEEMDL